MSTSINKVRFRVSLDKILILIYITSIFDIYGSARILIELGCIGLLFLLRAREGCIKIRFKDNKYYLWGIVFLAICFVSVMISESKAAALYGIRGILECFLAGVIVSLYITSEENVIFMIKGMVISACVLFGRIILTVPMDKILSREFSADLNANSLGMKMAICLLIVVWLGKEKYISIVSTMALIGLLTVGVLMSGSKKAFFIAICGLLLVFLFYQKNILKIMGYILVAIIALVVALWLVMNVDYLYNLIGYRLEGLFNALMYGADSGDASTRERILLMETAIEYWQRKPILGYGINCFGAIVQYSSYGHTNMYSHCNYTELLFGVGVIGTILYYAIFVWLLPICYKFQKRFPIFKILLVLIVLIVGLDIGMVSYGDEFMQFCIGLTAGCVALQKSINRKGVLNAS